VENKDEGISLHTQPEGRSTVAFFSRVWLRSLKRSREAQKREGEERVEEGVCSSVLFLDYIIYS
jgi:hypothetical protein